MRSGKTGQQRAAGLQAVELPDLRMAVAIGGVGELDRDERRAVGAVEPRPVGQQLRDELRADERRAGTR